MKLLGWILAAVVLPVLLADFTEAGPWLARKLIHRAVRRLPRSERSRWREEWLGNLADMPGALPKLLWALSIFLVGAGRMRRVLGAPPLLEVLWTRVQAAWKRLWSKPESPPGSPQEIELKVDSVFQKSEVQPVTLTVEAQSATFLLSSPRTGKSTTMFWLAAGSASAEQFEKLLVHHQCEFEQHLAQQQREFEQDLARRRREFEKWVDRQPGGRPRFFRPPT